MKGTIVIHPPVEEPRLEAIREASGGLAVVNTADEPAALAAMEAADAFIGKITPALLERSRRLRWVQSPTASLEHYLFAELVEHPSTLTNMRGIYSDVIADHVLGYVIVLARNFHIYLRRQLEGRWEACGGEDSRSDFLSGPGRVSGMDRAHRDLGDATLGVVGLGHIGAEIARRARAFDMRVIAVDPVRTDAPAEVSELRGTDHLPDLLAASDYVVIAAPHTPATEKLFRAEQFAAMKSSAYLINIGRGAIVDLADLCVALDSGTIAGAALDVFEEEPLPPGHPLWSMENVLITPHVAGCSPHVAKRHLEVIVENVGRFSRGEPLRNVVDKRRWF